MAATSEAAVLCAITVTGVAIWEEERVKTSACPLSFSHTHTHSLLPLSLSLSVFTLSAPHTPIHAAFLAVKLHFILLNLNTPGRSQKHACRAAWHPPWEPLLPLRSLAQQPEELCACCLTWFVLGCWSSMASVLSVAPVSLELCGSPPPPLLFIPSTGVQAAQSRSKASKRFARDSHPTGGTITRGFQNRWEEFSPNKITIHIPPNKEPVCRHLPLLPGV